MQHFTEDTLAATRADLPSLSPEAGPIIFAGTPEIAATCLAELLQTGARVAAVLTRPDAEIGRRRRLTPSPVAQVADEHGIPVIKANRVDAEVTAELVAVGAELGVVVAYGTLLPSAALEAPTRGWVNLHYSKLPAYRGAAPVPHALLAGETETAATVFQLERGMDTGPIHGLVSYRVQEATSSGTVLEDLTALGSRLLAALLPDLLSGASVPQTQEGEPSFAPKLTREDAFIDPRRPAAELISRINATIPEPGAWTLNGEQRIKLGVARIYRPAASDSAEKKPETEAPVAAEDTSQPETDVPIGTVLQLPAETAGAAPVIAFRAADGGFVVLSSVQPAGKQMINASDWFRGLQSQVRLGAPEAADADADADQNSSPSTPTKDTNP